MIATDKPIVLFGGGGFVGRHVAQELLSRGYRVRIAQRDARQAMGIRTLGGMGQTQFVAVDITDVGQVAAALEGASAAINLVGLLTGNMEAVHSLGARNIAQAAAAAGLASLVQISAIGADANSASAYGRTKAEGEAAVRAHFPSATILRPSIIFGQDDQFTNRFARLIVTASSVPVLHAVPVIRAATRFQPVHVADVAHAIALAAIEPRLHAGRTYELGGPDILSLREINGWIADQIGRDCKFLPIPDGVAKALATSTGWAPGAPITRDQFEMLLTDNVVAPGAPGFESFGITPAPMAAIAPAWLDQYRKHGRFGSTARA
ncbi:MAG: complex I NDUFA9 subunit family protein [Alphaproteobacteria bacterium]|nr:complex I NDUFA9 subunit family protein [Alphaproteobacteria bacterium]MBU0793097.1 complex I NDUFA9 subunit family protein [Alphaproteobacteria bacterium]MBU0876895.1 complex I NDUFA9 subunit family protein [Alphaproteobacteria bacterium]MBU1771127.1 complex I NDUFA9 subunit family protein [Alphaproteobacteria bacterium]